MSGKKLLRGSVMNIGEQVLRFAAVFVMTPIIIGSLGDTRYGYWALLMSILGNYAYLDFGISLSLAHFFSKAIGKGDQPRLVRLIGTAFAVFVRIGGVGLAITAVTYFALPLFIESPETLRTTRLIVVIYGSYLSLGFPVRVFRSLLKSHLRYDILAAAAAVQIITANILIYLYLKAGYGLVALALINAGAGFLEYTIVSFAGARHLIGLKVRMRHADREIRSELLGYSRVAFVTQIGLGLRSRLDLIVLGCFGMTASITYYTVGTRFPAYFAEFVGAVLGGQLLAILSRVFGRSGREATLEWFLAALRLGTVVAVFFGSMMIVYGNAFITRWMGPGFGDSYLVMAILAVPYIFQIMQFPSICLLYTLSKHKLIATTMIWGGVLNLILSVSLAYFLGFIGVVWATAIEMTILYTIVFPKIAAGAAGIPLSKIYLDALGRPAIVSVAILIPFYLFVERWIAPDYTTLIILGVVQSALFFPIAARFILSGEERSMIWSTLRRKKNP